MKFMLKALLLVAPFSVFSQHQASNWYFGQQAGLSFITDPPTVLMDGQTYLTPDPLHAEGSSSISDASGQLLCYCNGEAVWDREHQVMPNGAGLLGNPSSVQACLILPRPGSDRYFYVFTTDDWWYDQLAGGLRYSVIDICAEDGLGNITEDKNVLLLDLSAEKLTAVRHGNGIDFWIIAHKHFSDAFHAFLLTEDGIQDEVISNVGAYHPQGQETITAGAMGHLKASPNGEKLVIAGANSSIPTLEYLSFDKWTGIIGDPINLLWSPSATAYGLSFSPDNSKLYVTSAGAGVGIMQFDLQAGGGMPDSILASRFELPSDASPFFAIQLGPNGKIYVTRGSADENPYLSVIEEPNNAGNACGLIIDAVDLLGRNASWNLPNFLDSFDYPNNINACHNGIESYILHIKGWVHPNPAFDQMFIDLDRPVNSAIIELYNGLGNKMYTSNPKHGQKLIMERPAIPPGVYELNLIENGSKLFRSKVVLL